MSIPPATAKLMKELALNHAKHGHPHPERAVVLERIAEHLRRSPDILEQSPALQDLISQLNY